MGTPLHRRVFLHAGANAAPAGAVCFTWLAVGLVGCRAVLGIENEPPSAHDDTTRVAEVAKVEVPRFCETVRPAPQHCSDFETFRRARASS